MAKAGKTFFFATRWLNNSIYNDTVILYNFCRTIDDIADEAPITPKREQALTHVLEALNFDHISHPIVDPLRHILKRFPEIRRPLIALVVACRGDTPTLHIEDEENLEHYAHGVAGNVGLLMYPLLGGKDPAGRTYAARLGIAMQYTNIARDIIEDLTRGRVYLPSTWLANSSKSLTIESFNAHEARIATAVTMLLERANHHYAYGLRGLSYLDSRNRFAITVAARCYQAIGSRVLQNQKLSRSRAVVPLSQKLLLTAKIALGWSPVCAPCSTTTIPRLQNSNEPLAINE